MSTNDLPSPPTARVVRVLEALAQHADGKLSGAEIARAVQVAPATCHAILTTLTQAGYLVREPDNRLYRLGPALLAIGDAARRSFPVATFLRPRLEQLSNELGVPCTVAVRRDDEILILTSVGGDSSSTQGQRLPCAPPFGAVHVAWSAPETIERWLAAVPNDGPRDEYVALLADIRELGYAVGPLDEGVNRLRDLLRELGNNLLSDELRSEAAQLLGGLRLHDYAAADLAGRSPLAVGVVSAPVRDLDGQQVAVVSVHVLQPEVRPSEIRRIARSLLQATGEMADLLP